MRSKRTALGAFATIAVVLALGIPTAAHGESDEPPTTEPLGTEQVAPFTVSVHSNDASDTDAPVPHVEAEPDPAPSPEPETQPLPPAAEDPPAPDLPEPPPPADDTGSEDGDIGAEDLPGEEQLSEDPTVDESEALDEELIDSLDASLEEDDMVIAPLALRGETDIVITKVGDRAGNGITNGTRLPGAVFQVFSSTGSGNNRVPTGPALGSCTTGTNGQCTITIQNSQAGGSGNSRGVWVIEQSAPTGWNKIEAFGTGDYDQNKSVTQYRFWVSIGGNNAQGTTVNVPGQSTFPNQTKSGVWVNSRQNAPFPAICGLSVAMVFDTSQSIGQNDMTNMKNAARSFLGTDALGGTPSTVTMFRFDASASQMNSVPFQLVTQGNDSSGWQGARYMVQNSLPSQGVQGGTTNWDAALRLVANSGSYDIVLFLTDGDPTIHTGGSFSQNVQFLQLEQAVMSANLLKAQAGPSGAPTKVVGIGIGMSNNSDLNLRAITGNTVNDDYFQGNFTQLQGILQDIATRNCGGTLTVNKVLQAPDGTVIDDSASGWSFTATGDVVSGGSVTQVTGDSGTNFALQFPVDQAYPVTITETQQAGFELLSASCNGTPMTLNGLSFTVNASRQVITSCEVVNRQIPASVQVDKVWQIVDENGDVIRTIHDPAQPGDDTLPDGLSATLTLTGPGTAAASAQPWGQARSGYSVGSSVTINESVTLNTQQLPGCSLVSSLVTSGPDLADPHPPLPHSATVKAGLNSFAVTNTVKCETTLTLLKSVDSGSASPSLWNLVADDGTTQHSVSGASTASAANTFTVIADQEYALSEALADPNAVIAYRFERLERCTPTGGSCSWTTVDLSDTVSVALGQEATYRFVNAPMPPIGLPLTGGLGSDWVRIGGTLTMLIAAAGALSLVALKRRRTNLANSYQTRNDAQ